MIFRILILFLVALIQGCATTSPYCQVPQVSGEDSATLVIYRPDAAFGMFYSTPMSIDGCRIADLSNNSYQVFDLPSGNHRVAAEKKALATGGDGVIEGNFEAGKTYFLHYSMSPGSPFYLPGGGVGFTTSTTFFLVTKEHAIQAMPKLQGQF
ncbi:DUF2846 domain-containing protein [Neptuniibacter sp. UBA6509]|uniref:DUF2846 domain-containing protein n=1 Tax=Neptuniibacter sp. UBA6509 TaxID=1946976 RepID=UPI0025F8151D|nr:DUF2846 domain-containing protein [Neptuniibacter sp. UBA6509]